LLTFLFNALFISHNIPSAKYCVSEENCSQQQECSQYVTFFIIVAELPIHLNTVVQQVIYHQICLYFSF